MKKEISCLGSKEIVCPYCGHEFSDSWEYDALVDTNGDEVKIDCEKCNKKFMVIVHRETTYSSYKKE